MFRLRQTWRRAYSFPVAKRQQGKEEETEEEEEKKENTKEETTIGNNNGADDDDTIRLLPEAAAFATANKRAKTGSDRPCLERLMRLNTECPCRRRKALPRA